MISRLSGAVMDIAAQMITLDVNGVGYAVSVADERLFKVGQLVDLPIYYHWNQENGPQLFGFDSLLAKTVFAQILSCTGCGPKIGLAVLGHMPPEQFLQAVSLGDVKALSAVNGIGPKKAELMIMQLKDKVLKITPAIEPTALVKMRQLRAALESLNYRPAEITHAFEQLKKNSVLEAPFDELLRSSLSYLAKRF